MNGDIKKKWNGNYSKKMLCNLDLHCPHSIILKKQDTSSFERR